MRLKKMICMVFACILMIGTGSFPVRAAEVETAPGKSFVEELIMPLATNSFNMSIPAKSQVKADSSFSLVAGETVTINASYAPFDASMDFGLVDSDGVFHYFNVTDGSIDKTMQIEKSGSYTLQVRNNSSTKVKVSGFVNY